MEMKIDASFIINTLLGLSYALILIIMFFAKGRLKTMDDSIGSNRKNISENKDSISDLTSKNMVQDETIKQLSATTIKTDNSISNIYKLLTEIKVSVAEIPKKR